MRGEKYGIPSQRRKNRTGTSGFRSAASWLRYETELALRLMASNFLVAVPPTVLFAVAAGAHYSLPFERLLAGIGKATLVGLLALYVSESANQAHAGVEDAYNKPHRPIPAGMATAEGLTRRFWMAMPFYTVAGWAFGTLPWVLMWQVTVVLHYRWGSPRLYLYWKPFYNIAGASAPLATGWQVTAPFDAIAWTWLGFMALYFPLALIYEDVRDMEGDRAVERRTLALVLGPKFVRRWFATLVLLLPLVFYFVPARLSDAGDWPGIVCAAVLAMPSWFCAVRALRLHKRAADHLTYQLFTLTWALTVATAPLLLAQP
ncbi:UbiA family prenyltransferase [Streptomyces tendae]|uniref:UbiA family prenyltransferase n=1 Tax=Streptomyces tendae TaxID=1932 RepID=UPI003713F1E9